MISRNWNLQGRDYDRNEQERIQYDRYVLSPFEWIRYLIQGTFVCGILAYVFYRNMFSFFLLLPLGLLYPVYRRRSLKEQRKEELKRQFKEAVLMLSSCLFAGYSMENSFSQAEVQLRELYGKNGMMAAEFQWMRKNLSMNRTMEELWSDFAERSGVEEIRSFAQIFRVAKRGGGQMGIVISHIAEIIGGKMQVKEEIRMMTAQKQLEQRIMNTLPVLIVLYVDMTSPGFFDVMYKTAVGRIVMTVCFLSYAGAYLMAERMLKIEI